MGVADTEITPLEVEAQDQDTDADTKYIKRQSALQRSLKRLIPSAFQPTLPVTTRCACPHRVIRDRQRWITGAEVWFISFRVQR